MLEGLEEYLFLFYLVENNYVHINNLLMYSFFKVFRNDRRKKFILYKIVPKT